MESFESKVLATINEHDLITEGDSVLVAVSGGKDSTTALYVLKKLGYDVSGIIIDQLLGEYSKKNMGNIKSFCAENDIVLHVVEMSQEYGFSVCYMQSVLEQKGEKLSTCHICGVVRRDILNRKALELKADKIATGHNLDDEAQNFMMNFIQGNMETSARLGPKSGVGPNPGFVQRIKPLYFCSEADCEKYSRIMGFPVVYDPCPCSMESFRTGIKAMMNKLEELEPCAKRNIVDTFLKIVPRGQKATLKKCERCSSPSSRDICRKCEIFAKMAD